MRKTPEWLKNFNWSNWKRGSRVVLKKAASPTKLTNNYIKATVARVGHAARKKIRSTSMDSQVMSPRALKARKNAAKNIARSLYNFVKNSYPHLPKSRVARVDARMKKYISRQGSL
jgi:hypothetical protein